MTRRHGGDPSTTSLRVVHVIGGLGVGGAETALLGVAKAFHGSDVTCKVIALGTEGGMRTRFEQAGIPLQCFDFKRRPLHSAWGLFRALREERPDIVQTWMYHADLIGGLAARLAGCRAVLWGVRAVGLASDAPFTTRVVRRACAVLSRSIPQMILCVATAAKTSHARLGYDARRMVVLPNGYDFQHMRPAEGARERLRATWGIPAGATVIGAVGRFCDEKDYPNLIGAAARIAREREDVRFLLVGRGLEDGNPVLARLIEASGHADRFILAGERGDVLDCLSAMDLFCLSSRMEAFPNVLVEAMAMGLPCVSTDAGDAAMILSGTGVLVPREDEARLAEGLRSLMAWPKADLVALGARAKVRVTSEFSIQQACKTLRDLYLGMLEKGR